MAAGTDNVAAPIVPRAGHGKAHNLLEAFGITTSYFFVAMLAFRSISQVKHTFVYESAAAGWIDVAMVASAVLAGYVVADWFSGFVHFIFDRYGSPQTFLLGPNFVTPFREHHSDPIDITRHGFLETNGNNCLATVIPLWLIFIAPFSYDAAWWHWTSSMLTAGAVATFATNQFHKWAHTKDAPGYITWLQKRHLILPVDHHQIHHTWPYETYYCITTGWLNWPLHKLGFWRMLEAVAGLVGATAYRDLAPVYPEPGRTVGVVPPEGKTDPLLRAAE
jgi:plasmanylethanolamine desaturase